LFEGYTTNSLREALRLLLHAHGLILAPEHWTKEAWARDGKGNPVYVDHMSAHSWCVSGAVLRAQSDLYDTTGPMKVVEEDKAGEIVAVLGPKRVGVALQLLGRSLLIANRRIIDDKTVPKKTGREKKGSAPHWTMLASIVNDLPQIEHAHVLLGLAVAVDAVHEELYARSRTSAGKAGGAQ
jgi:hypothetical protein